MTTNDPSAKTIYAIGLKYSSLDVEDIEQLTEILLKKQNEIDPAYVKQLEDQLGIYKSEFSKIELQRSVTEIEDMRTDIEKTQTEIENIKAKTVHELEKARQTTAENSLIREGTPQVNVNI